jgi:acetyl esterase/lipase
MKIKVKSLPIGFKEYTNPYHEDSWGTESGAYQMRRWYLNYNRRWGMKDDDAIIYFHGGRWHMGLRVKKTK